MKTTKMLSNNQKKFLRSLGHSLNPVVMVGQQGLSEAVLAEIKTTMTKHELLKIKVSSGDREDKKKIIEDIISNSKADLIQVIGSIALIYRAFRKDPQIKLPKK